VVLERKELLDAGFIVKSNNNALHKLELFQLAIYPV
jgi:hypothetical protein